MLQMCTRAPVAVGGNTIIYSGSRAAADSAALAVVSDDCGAAGTTEKADEVLGVRTAKNHVRIDVEVIELGRRGNFALARNRVRQIMTGMAPPKYLIVSGVDGVSSGFVDKVAAMVTRPSRPDTVHLVPTGNLSRVPASLRSVCRTVRVASTLPPAPSHEAAAATLLSETLGGETVNMGDVRQLVSDVVARRLNVYDYVEAYVRSIATAASDDRTIALIDAMRDLCTGLDRGHNRGHHLELFITTLVTALGDEDGISCARHGTGRRRRSSSEKLSATGPQVPS